METEYQRLHRVYIDSPEWKARRKLYFEAHPERCAACGLTSQIHLHHRTYARMGKEKDKDLVPLCSIHHGLVHDRHKANGGTLSEATNHVIAHINPREITKLPPTVYKPAKKKRAPKTPKPKSSPLTPEEKAAKKAHKKAARQLQREQNLAKGLTAKGYPIDRHQREPAKQGDIIQCLEDMEKKGIPKRFYGIPLVLTSKDTLTEAQRRRKNF